jgi:hypothetical protein
LGGASLSRRHSKSESSEFRSGQSAPQGGKKLETMRGSQSGGRAMNGFVKKVASVFAVVLSMFLMIA